MKTIIKLIIVCAALACFVACKKQTAIPAKDNGKPAPKVYTYRLDVNNWGKPDNAVTGDSLYVAINSTVICNATGKNIPHYIADLRITTGDRLVIRYNPGKFKWGEEMIYEFNYLDIMFEGGYKNPTIKWACRCRGVWDGIIEDGLVYRQ